MAYRLKTTRSARKSLRRAAQRQLEGAAHELATATPEKRATAVHEARKSVKKTRALLRLARSGMPKADYRAQMRTLRDTGRLLSGTRDADVLVPSLDGLFEHAGEPPIPVRDRQALRRDVARLAAVPAPDDQVDQARAALEALTASTADWPLQDVRWSTVRKDAERTYARGQEGFEQARGASDPELLHEWRKRVKDLWYHQRLLRNAWKPVLRAHASETDRLGELLGDDHDLAVLAAFLDTHRDELGRHRHLDELVDRIAQRRAELQEAAVVLGARIYGERPGAYGKRIGRYLKTSRAGTSAPLPTP